MSQDERPEKALILKTRLLTLVAVVFSLSFLAGLILILQGDEPGGGAYEQGEPARAGIAVLELEGTIEYSSRQGFIQPGGRGIADLVETLRKFGENRQVRGLVLRINSPGGSIGATQELYEALKRFKSTGKPLVVSMGDIAASGGYYIACAADQIYANPGSLTGSIGVIISSPDLHGLYEWARINWNTIKSGRFKDILSPYREMAYEERLLLEEMVKDAFGQFFEAVHTARTIEKERLEELAQGQLFSGRQAKEAGLIDEVGDFEAALLKAGSLAGISGRPSVIRARQNPSLAELLGLAVKAFSEPRGFVLPGLTPRANLPLIAYLSPGSLQ